MGFVSVIIVSVLFALGVGQEQIPKPRTE